uniref:CSON010111 protein n=1 Tax=Culicoides sonorensis TaxID=179676 RepID=A0A336LK38_CULSO
MIRLLVLFLISGTVLCSEESLPSKMNKTIFIADKTPRRSSSSGGGHVPLFIIRPMSSHKIKAILPPHHYKAYTSNVHGLPEYTVKDKDVITLERLLPMLGIYPNKIIYKNPEYETAPKVQHIYLPVPKEPVYHHNNYHHISTKPTYVDYNYHYSPHRTLMHTSISGSSDIGLKNISPYNSNPPAVYYAPAKGSGHHTITTPVHIKEDYVPKIPPTKESFIPIQSHPHTISHHPQPYVHQHVTPTPILKYLTPDHFVPIHPTIPTIPNHHIHSLDHHNKPHLHFYSAHDHSEEHSDNHLGDHHEHHDLGPHLAADVSDENEHEHYHIGTHPAEQQHSDTVHHQIQAKQYTPPLQHPIFQQKPHFLYQSHYKVLPLVHNNNNLPKAKPDIKFRSELGATKPLVVKPYPNNLYYPLSPPSYIRKDPNVKPVVEQAVEESLRRHQTTKLSKTDQQNTTANNPNTDETQFKPMIMQKTETSTSERPVNAGSAYTMMSNKCEEKCNAETKMKDENSETICGTDRKMYATKSQFICAQKCGQKELQPQPLNKCKSDGKS